MQLTTTHLYNVIYRERMGVLTRKMYQKVFGGRALPKHIREPCNASPDTPSWINW